MASTSPSAQLSKSALGSLRVTWLDVSVEIAMLVHVRKPLEDLVDDAAYSCFRERLRPVLDQLVQIAVLPVHANVKLAQISSARD